MRKLTVFGIMGLLVTSLGAQLQWTEDWDGAISQAKKDGRDLLVDFTGSDWCVWCQRLSEEVFVTPEYFKGADKNFVHVKLDYPQRLPQTPAIKARNRQLAETYGVEGYPTILLMDSSLRVYGKTGYQAGGGAAYINHLEGFRQNKAKLFPLLNQADKVSGVEKAKLLDQFLQMAEEMGLESYYSSLPPLIIKNDPTNAAGLRTKYELRAQLNTLLSTLTEKSNFAQVEKDLLTLEQKAVKINSVKQEIMYFRAMVILNGTKDIPRGKSLLLEVQKVDPTTRIGKAIPEILKQLK